MIACTNPGGARHENLSWFMIDADLPGITVQPMELMGTGGEGGTDPVQKNTVFFCTGSVPPAPPVPISSIRCSVMPARSAPFTSHETLSWCATPGLGHAFI